MPKGILFWVIWVVAFFLCGAWRAWPDRFNNYGPWSLGAFVMAMLFILGWQNFGFVVR